MRTDERSSFDLKTFLFFVGGTLLAGFLGGLLGGTSGYETLRAPALAPPAFLFPIVWTILYLLSGIAAYLVYQSRDQDRAPALRRYLLMQAVSVTWPFFFFRLGWRGFALLWLILLLVLLAVTVIAFRPIRPATLWLLLPYLLWCLFAAYLNIAYYWLNR